MLNLNGVAKLQDIGWSDWILSPAGYDMNYCAGNCLAYPMPDHFNTTNHAIFQVKAKEKNIFKAKKSVPSKVMIVPFISNTYINVSAPVEP